MKKKSNIFDTILFSFLLALIIGTLVYISKYTNPATYIKDTYLFIVTLLIILCFLIKSLIPGRIKLNTSKFLLIIIIFLFYMLVSTIKSSDIVLSFTQLNIYIFYSIFYILCINIITSEKKIKSVLSILIISTGFIIFYALLQHNNIDFYQWGRTYTLFENENILRIISSLGNPNFLGAFLTLIIPLIMSLTIAQFNGFIYLPAVLSLGILIIAKTGNISFLAENNIPKPDNILLTIIFISCLYFILIHYLNRKFKKQLIFISVIFGVILSVLALIILFLTYNRSAYLAVTISILFLIIIYLHYKKILKQFIARRIIFLGLIVIVALVTTFIFIPQSSYIAYRYIDMIKTRTIGIQLRLKLWNITGHIIRNNLLTGTGIGTFPAHFPSETDEGWKQLLPHGKYIVEHCHSELLEITQETGIIGLILLVYIIIIISIHLIRLMRNASNRFTFHLTAGISSGFLGILIHSFFSTKTRYQTTMIPLLVLLAITEILSRKIYKKYKSDNKIFEISYAGSHFLLVTFFLVLLLINYSLYPLISNVLFNNARIYLPVNRLKEAVEMTNKSLEYNKFNTASMYMNSRIMFAMGKTNEAIMSGMYVLYRFPFYKDANLHLSNCYFRQALNKTLDIKLKKQALNESLYYLKRQSRISDTSDIFGLRYAEILFENKKYKKAQEIIKSSMIKLKDRDRANYLLGKIQLIKSMPEKAFDSLNSAIYFNSNAPDAYYKLAETMFELKHYNSSIMTYYYAYSLYNDVHFNKQDWDKIIDSFMPLLEKNRLTESGLFYLAALMQENNYLEKSEHIFKTLLTNKKYRMDCLIGLLKIYTKNKDTNKLNKINTQIKNEFPLKRDNYFILAGYYYSIKDYENFDSVCDFLIDNPNHNITSLLKLEGLYKSQKIENKLKKTISSIKRLSPEFFIPSDKGGFFKIAGHDLSDTVIKRGTTKTIKITYVKKYLFAEKVTPLFYFKTNKKRYFTQVKGDSIIDFSKYEVGETFKKSFKIKPLNILENDTYILGIKHKFQVEPIAELPKYTDIAEIVYEPDSVVKSIIFRENKDFSKSEQLLNKYLTSEKDTDNLKFAIKEMYKTYLKNRNYKKIIDFSEKYYNSFPDLVYKMITESLNISFTRNIDELTAVRLFRDKYKTDRLFRLLKKYADFETDVMFMSDIFSIHQQTDLLKNDINILLNIIDAEKSYTNIDILLFYIRYLDIFYENGKFDAAYFKNVISHIAGYDIPEHYQLEYYDIFLTLGRFAFKLKMYQTADYFFNFKCPELMTDKKITAMLRNYMLWNKSDKAKQIIDKYSDELNHELLFNYTKSFYLYENNRNLYYDYIKEIGDTGVRIKKIIETPVTDKVIFDLAYGLKIIDIKKDNNNLILNIRAEQFPVFPNFTSNYEIQVFITVLNNDGKLDIISSSVFSLDNWLPGETKKIVVPAHFVPGKEYYCVLRRNIIYNGSIISLVWPVFDNKLKPYFKLQRF